MRLLHVLDDDDNDITHPDWVDDLKDYSAKLDRLVKAARDAKKILNHDGGTTHDATTRYGCATELVAALAEIELPEE